MPAKNFEIGNRIVGDDAPCLLIGEVAQAHDGSLGTAHAYIDAVANAGADAVKFQTHIANAESTLGEKFRVNFSFQDKTRQDYWRRMEFSETEWAELMEHAKDRGLIFLSSPFSIEALDMLDRLGVPAWKVASGEISNKPLLEKMNASSKPILLSSGLSSWKELDQSVNWLTSSSVGLAVFQCTSAYPTSPEEIGLNLLTEFKERYDVPVGLSDHSGTIFPGLAAVAWGAKFIEVHVTLSRESFGPDVAASITTSELRQLSEGIRFIETTMANPVEKDRLATKYEQAKILFTKSVVPAHDLSAGETLTREMLTTKKPGTGIPAANIDAVIGKKTRRTLQADELFTFDDLFSSEETK